MKTHKRSSTVERRKSILNLINESGQVLVHELSKEFNVSEVTIRNDLEQLEKKNMLIRARGGAIKAEGGVGIDYHLSEKDKLNNEEKARIGKRAAQLINEHDTIIIDSGTTTMEVAKNLGHLTDLTVICNAINIISQLIQLNNLISSSREAICGKIHCHLLVRWPKKICRIFMLIKYLSALTVLTPNMGSIRPILKRPILMR